MSGLIGNPTSRSTYNKLGFKTGPQINPLEQKDNCKVNTNLVKPNDKYVNLFNPQNYMIDTAKCTKINVDELIEKESKNVEKDLKIKHKKEEASKSKTLQDLLTDPEKQLVEKRSLNQIQPSKTYVEVNGQKIDAMALISDTDFESLIKKYNIKVEQGNISQNSGTGNLASTIGNTDTKLDTKETNPTN